MTHSTWFQILTQIIGIQPGELRRYFGSSATKGCVFGVLYNDVYFDQFYSGKNKIPRRRILSGSHLIEQLDERFERLQR